MSVLVVPGATKFAKALREATVKKRFQWRSSRNGRYVTKAAAAADPAGTVAEAVPAPSAVIGYAQSLCLTLEAEGDLAKVSDQTVAAYTALMRVLKA